jgi:hypothetical protein
MFLPVIKWIDWAEARVQYGFNRPRHAGVIDKLLIARYLYRGE